MTATLDRRTFCAVGVAAAVPTAAARAAVPTAVASFETRELRVAQGAAARRVKVFWPRGVSPAERLPALVLFHGLGETVSETLGINAWADRYGLLDAHARLLHPPITGEGSRGDLPLDRARALNTELSARPFDGKTVFICPFTPNVWRAASPSAALEALANWTADELLPEVRLQAPVALAPHSTSLDGCSLGGFIALEVFLRRPEAFGACGTVQAALREQSASRWAGRVATAFAGAGARPLRIATSRGDPFLRANVALSRELTRRAIAHELSIASGPHDQPWLRQVGTLELLLWHDRLRGQPRAPADSPAISKD